MANKVSTPEEELVLINLWNADLSASVIAEQIGGITRNTVIGRISRLMSKGDVRITRAKSTLPRRSVPRTFKVRQPKEAVMSKPPAAKAAIEAPDNSKRISILDVGRNQCRFPVDDNDLSIYCGHPGYPYCTYHRAQCYTRVPGTSEDRAKALAASRNSGSKRQFGG